MANVQQELATLVAERPHIPVFDACSDVYLNDGENVTAFVHNEDYGTAYFDTIYFVRMRLFGDDGRPARQLSTFSYPGILPGWAPGALLRTEPQCGILYFARAGHG